MARERDCEATADKRVLLDGLDAHDGFSSFGPVFCKSSLHAHDGFSVFGPVFCKSYTTVSGHDDRHICNRDQEIGDNNMSRPGGGRRKGGNDEQASNLKLCVLTCVDHKNDVCRAQEPGPVSAVTNWSQTRTRSLSQGSIPCRSQWSLQGVCFR